MADRLGLLPHKKCQDARPHSFFSPIPINGISGEEAETERERNKLSAAPSNHI
ncbi:hypothetical protein HMPREF3226_01431 [Prevotella corporis]|uniref:Uncharacterized protein n=1 Tax=Prevotella corporis TaxID=28128 RepID=A0A133Q812_9BACT|nr:hypothetical protein HMPREF3226_01431 [Prevotella corporis]